MHKHKYLHTDAHKYVNIKAQIHRKKPLTTGYTHAHIHKCTYKRVHAHNLSSFFDTNFPLRAFYGQVVQDINNRLSEMDLPESVV